MAEQKAARRRRLTLLDYALMAAVALAFRIGAATALGMKSIQNPTPAQAETT